MNKLEYDDELCEVFSTQRRNCRGCQLVWFDYILEETHKNVLEQNKQ